MYVPVSGPFAMFWVGDAEVNVGVAVGFSVGLAVGVDVLVGFAVGDGVAVGGVGVGVGGTGDTWTCAATDWLEVAPKLSVTETVTVQIPVDGGE